MARLKVRIRLWNDEYEYYTEDIVPLLESEKARLQQQLTAAMDEAASLKASAEQLESRLREEMARADELQRRFDYSRENSLEHENAQLK